MNLLSYRKYQNTKCPAFVWFQFWLEIARKSAFHSYFVVSNPLCILLVVQVTRSTFINARRMRTRVIVTTFRTCARSACLTVSYIEHIASYPGLPVWCIERACEKSGRPGRLCDVMMTCGHYLGRGLKTPPIRPRTLSTCALPSM